MSDKGEHGLRLLSKYRMRDEGELFSNLSTRAPFVLALARFTQRLRAAGREVTVRMGDRLYGDSTSL